MTIILEENINPQIFIKLQELFGITKDDITFLCEDEDSDNVIAFLVCDYRTNLGKKEDLQLDIVSLDETEVTLAQWLGDFFVEEFTLELN